MPTNQPKVRRLLFVGSNAGWRARSLCRSVEVPKQYWPRVVYIYSKYERTWWRLLQTKYPDECTTENIQRLFDPAVTVDLYQVVAENSEWPTNDHSIKTLANYLGFKWSDSHPSGAASIEWYDRYCGCYALAKARILEYNEDDCRAMRVLADA